MSRIFPIALYACVTLILLLCAIPPSHIPYAETLRQWKFFYVSIILLGIILFILVTAVNDEYKSYYYRSVSFALLLTGGVESLWGILQMCSILPSFNSTHIVTGSFFNSGPYACYLAMCIPVGIELIYQTNETHKRIVCVVVALMFMLLIVTMSRTGCLAAFISVLCYFCISKPFLNDKKLLWNGKRRLSYVILFIFVSILLIISMFTLCKIDSAKNRIQIWKIELLAIAEKPNGYGRGQFQMAFSNAQERLHEKSEAVPLDHISAPYHAFNEYLSLAIEYGVATLSGAMLLIFFLFRYLYRKKKDGLFCALLSLAVSSIASYPFHFPLFVMSLLLLFCCPLVDYIFVHRAKYIIMPLSILVVLFYVCFLNIHLKQQKIKACLNWSAIRVYWGMRLDERAYPLYQAMFKEMKWNDMFLYEYGALLSRCGKYKISNDVMFELSLRNSDIAPLLTIADNFINLGQYKSSEFILCKARNRQPNKILPYYKLIKLYSCREYYNYCRLQETINNVEKLRISVVSPATNQMMREIEKIKGYEMH